MIYGSCYKECTRHNFGSFFYPLTVWKMKISKKWKNAWRYHHFTQVHQKSWSYAILFLWCVTDVIVIFYFGLFFLPFYPNNSPKNENFKKMEKILAIPSFYKSVPKIRMICFTGPEIWHMKNIIIFHFGLFLHFYPHNRTKNETLKKQKTPGDIIILHNCTKNYD